MTRWRALALVALLALTGECLGGPAQRIHLDDLSPEDASRKSAMYEDCSLTPYQIEPTEPATERPAPARGSRGVM